MKREFKGHILKKLPADYVILDIRTTGADPNYDTITMFEAVYYLNGEEIERFSETFTENENENINVLRHLQQFIGKRPLIGYSILFTIDFLYDAFITYLDNPLPNDYLDLKEVLRKTECLKINYSLDMACKELKLIQTEDIQITKADQIKAVLDYAKQEIFHSERVECCKPFENRRCVFTGKMQRLELREVDRLLLERGGIKCDRVTMKTNYLILGNHDYCSNIEAGKSNKQRKAEELKQRGYDIEIISENVFYDLIDV